MIKNIIFDFDGVILASVPTKTEGYRLLFKDYSTDLIEKMVQYHELNGGISRYEKVKYFFNTLLKENISEKDIQYYANKYSELTKEELTNKKYLINDTLEFIQQNYHNYNMHIASGADESDLRYICDNLDLNHYFKSINGSPTKKTEIVSNILINNNYNENETILIGDSINDYEAANANNIGFYGYNNVELKRFDYIKYMKDFKL